MPDVPMLTVPELEALLVSIQLPNDGYQHLDWRRWLELVCRQALAQAAEIEALTGLTGAETNELLERWDQTAPHIQRGIVAAFAQRCAKASAQRDKLQAFKDWCHNYLDAHGVPHHPPGTHGAEGCRIGDRMDWLMARLHAEEAEVKRLIRACVQQQFDIEQTLGKALRYPVAGPEIGGNGTTVECGEHIAETLAIEAAEEIGRLRALPDRICAELASNLRDIASRIGPARLPESIRAELEALANRLSVWSQESPC